MAFAKAWYKLTHRDMGPATRLLGPEVAEAQVWQDPIPAVDHTLVTDAEVTSLKEKVMALGFSHAELVTTAWSSASTYRDTDKRGGANGARILLAPQKDWTVNQDGGIAKVLAGLQGVQQEFNSGREDGMKISMADLIVLAGGAAIEDAAKNAGVSTSVPFAPGRMDATQEMTEVDSFGYLEPKTDGFRNYIGSANSKEATENLVDHADVLNLSATEMTVLIGGMRAMGVSYGDGAIGLFGASKNSLNNDFFVQLLDMSVVWKASVDNAQIYEGTNRETGAVERKATAIDLLFGSNSQLRALCEVYAADDAKEKLVTDFVAAWYKVMSMDRFDLRISK